MVHLGHCELWQHLHCMSMKLPHESLGHLKLLTLAYHMEFYFVCFVVGIEWRALFMLDECPTIAVLLVHLNFEVIVVVVVYM